MRIPPVQERDQAIVGHENGADECSCLRTHRPQYLGSLNEVRAEQPGAVTQVREVVDDDQTVKKRVPRNSCMPPHCYAVAKYSTAVNASIVAYAASTGDISAACDDSPVHDTYLAPHHRGVAHHGIRVNEYRGRDFRGASYKSSTIGVSGEARAVDNCRIRCRLRHRVNKP